MKPFEIPYNFDTQLINFLTIYKNINIHSIYLPPFRGHYMCAKTYYRDISQTLPKDIEEYEYHIHYIQKYFPDKIMLLLQQNDILLEEEYLKYYINLGITKFCVGSKAQAIAIRALLPTAEIIGSITMKIDKYKLAQDDYSMFDNFVLWFPFNRNIEAIKELPTNYSYTLLVNCGCSIYCEGTGHWLAKDKRTEQERCDNCITHLDHFFEHTIIVPPQDIKYFDPYINCLKLQGREYSTTKIITDIVSWTSNRVFPINYNPYEIYNIKN